VFGPERHDRIALLAPRDGAGVARHILNDITAAAGEPFDCREHRVLEGEPMSRRASGLLAPCHQLADSDLDLLLEPPIQFIRGLEDCHKLPPEPAEG